ncbi:perivitellin-2 67 kDa subunit-like [Physella acuta]|uniref:perivitellin-2 67 kDa subunit-like n=1 Tax=Physella acuta TaxID=109671 RepID=UPI0027DDFAE4|nr:perivitellin-2 67 kDa subunit-like [Physella acuta]
MAKLDLLPVEIVGDDGIMKPVFPLTCDDEREWKDAKGKKYELPDQIWQITTVPGGYTTSEVSTSTSYSDVRSHLASSVSVDAAIGDFSFSISNTYKKMQTSITNGSRYLSEVTSFAGASRMDVVPPADLELDSYPKEYVDKKLNVTFESNPDIYYKFIEIYGTHYWSRANFGGYVKMVCETTKEYFESSTQTEIEANAQATFVVMVGGGGGTGKGSASQSYTSNTKTSIKFYGGDPNVLAKDGFAKWQPTVDSDPWLFSGRLKPISDLFKNATKKAEMVKAVKNYLIKNYILEQERLVLAAKARSDNNIVNQLLADVLQLKKAAFPVEWDVTVQGMRIAKYFSTPTWFLKSKLCMIWKGTKDAAQCGGSGVPAQICAQTNNMTQWYLDNTDSRQGGCKMQWGILSSGYEGFFESISICYEFAAENDIAQCGGLAGRSYCSPTINNFTTEYLDDTAGRKGGCKMRWMLKVPTSVAPIWMQAVQLCFKWEADGDAAQCGGGAENSQCVNSNQWTKFYTDTTDDRKGGCKMSWGLKSA